MKQVLVCLAVLACVAFVAMPTTSHLMAAPNNAASIDKDFGCNLFDGNGFLVSANAKNISVVTSSGHTTLKCSSKGVTPAANGRAAVQSGFLCNTMLGLTTDTHSTVSASGNSKLTCRI